MRSDFAKQGEKQVDTRLFVSSVGKALRVMEAFDETEQKMTLSRIAEKTGLGRSAAQRFVYTLETLGYLKREQGAPGYSLSNRALLFVRGLLSANSAFENALPLLKTLAEETGETASWVECDGSEIIIIGGVPSPNRSAVILPVGSRYKALTASSGHLFLADQPEDYVRALYEEADDASLDRLDHIGADAYLELIRKERTEGLCVTEKDVDLSSISISAPVEDFRGKMFAAINVSALKGRVRPEEVQSRIVPLIKRTAELASGNLTRD